jgi:hypothetical protein
MPPRPAAPRSVCRGARGGAIVGARAEDNHADDANEGHRGEAHGQGDQHARGGKEECIRQVRQPELLEEGFQQVPLGDESGGGWQPGQGDLADGETGWRCAALPAGVNGQPGPPPFRTRVSQ